MGARSQLSEKLRRFRVADETSENGNSNIKFKTQWPDSVAY